MTGLMYELNRLRRNSNRRSLRSVEKHFQEKSVELQIPFDFAQGRPSRLRSRYDKGEGDTSMRSGC